MLNIKKSKDMIAFEARDHDYLLLLVCYNVCNKQYNIHTLNL